MARTVVLGTSGAGKTTLARTLAARLGVPLVELDELATGPHWTTVRDDALRVSLTRMVRRTRRLVAEQPELWHGNRERWRPGHLTWLIWEIRSHLRRRVMQRRRLARHPGLSVVHLRSQAAVDAWLESARRE